MTEWITPIFDRTYGDVLQAELDRDMINPKGCYNANDLNRIENNIQYIAEDMLARKIIRSPLSMEINTTWIPSNIPTRDDMRRIIQNVQLLMERSNPVVQEDFSIIYESTQFTYTLANAIERNLQIMKDQPELPVQKWLLQVEHGIIEEYGKSAEYIAEDEVVHIKAVPYGENAPYMLFNHWSGDPDDLQYLDNVEQQETTFTMVYHDSESYEVHLTAEFDTRFPRKLTLHGGTIYDEIGGTTRTLFAGDEVLILADEALPGKAFYEWQGTEEGIDNLTGGPQPSTSWLVMPDCDVELTSFYINAGKHKVTIDGEIQGWYDYNESVFLSADSPGIKYSFDYWSGDTGYLDDISSSMLTMPDINLVFYSHWKYNYSYNTVDVIDGTIDGETHLENLQERSSHSLAAIIPENKGFDYWSKEGLGSFGNAESGNTSFIIGDGNAVITAHFTDLRNLTVENVNNNGESTTTRVTQGKETSVSTNEMVGDKMFDYWERDGSKVSSSTTYRFTMPQSDVVVKAIYRDKRTVNVEIDYGSHKDTVQMLERSSMSITADTPTEGYEWGYWSYTGLYTISGKNILSNTSSQNPATITAGSVDATVKANFDKIPDEKIYHTVTVNNGSGSGRYYEGQRVEINGNQAPDTYEFDYWTKNDSEDKVSTYQVYSFYMGTEDVEYTAHYKPIPFFNVEVRNGHLSDGSKTGRFQRNSNPRIIMDPAPEGMQFLQWEVLEGDKQNGVTEPLAENTTLRNLLADTVVQATYYIPDPKIKYTLTVTNKGGRIETYNEPAGTQIEINADRADEGYKFYMWTGDTQYVNDIYAEKAIVNMPPRNIELQVSYMDEDGIPRYAVHLENGELVYETTDEGEERWASNGEFKEGSTVKIRVKSIPIDSEFDKWENTVDGDERSIETVKDILEPETTLQVRNFRIDLSAKPKPKDTYTLEIIDGEISKSCFEGEPAMVYFNKENTDTIHYDFIRWSGDDLAYIKLFDGGAFDIYKGGNVDDYQTIKMPARNITIKAIYDTSYLLKVNNGTNEGFYKEGETISISANEPEENYKFSHWEGDISCINDGKTYNPNITITMPNGPITLTAKYTDKNSQNDIGYTLTDIYNNDNISIENIIVISGTIQKGFIITDTLGHIYVVTDIISNTANITRLTTKQGGNTNGE